MPRLRARRHWHCRSALGKDGAGTIARFPGCSASSEINQIEVSSRWSRRMNRALIGVVKDAILRHRQCCRYSQPRFRMGIPRGPACRPNRPFANTSRCRWYAAVLHDVPLNPRRGITMLGFTTQSWKHAEPNCPEGIAFPLRDRKSLGLSCGARGVTTRKPSLCWHEVCDELVRRIVCGCTPRHNCRSC